MSIENFMMHAIHLAKIAFNNNEVPVGAIVVKDGQVIGEGFNQVISKNSVTSHAEINAINSASETLKNYRLNNCDMYVTLEPCHMCAKAIVDARMNHVYFAAREPKTGALESVDQFFDKYYLNHQVKFSGGHLEAESSKLLKKFFRFRRDKSSL